MSHGLRDLAEKAAVISEALFAADGMHCKVADVRANLDAACKAHCTCGGREREDQRACVACRIWYQMEVGQ